MLRRSLILVLLVASPAGAAGPSPAPSPSPAPAGGLSSLGQVAEQQKSPEQERLDSAVRLFREEQYAPAAVAFYDLAQSPEASAQKEAAEYNLAKSLYRLRLHHSALGYFERLLQRGPEGRYYRSALEWSLFIARKIIADDRVLDAVAKYTDGKFPDEYKNEFRYLLARHHYLEGVAIESGAEVGNLGEAHAEETVTGGLSLKGDVFGGEEGGPGDAKGGSDAEVKKKAGGGLSIEDDIFGGDDDSPKKNKGKGKGKGKGKNEPKSEIKVEPSPEPKPKTETKPKTEPGKKVGTTSAEGLTAKEHFEASSRYLIQVEANSPFSAKAKFLEGVLMYRDKKENEALDAFKAVVRMTKPGAPQEDAWLRQLAFFQLARAHFGAKQPSFSIYYYDRVQRFTYEWLEAIYESSWAEFRLGNYEKALGNLLTLHSPFFSDQYFPESHILKAVVYYENCRYPEAKEILASFQKRYGPVQEELKSMTARTQSPDKYYEALENLRSQDLAEGTAEKTKILSQILGIALSDDELKKLDDSYKEVDTEMKGLPGVSAVFAGSKLKVALDEDLTKVRADYQKAAGRAVKRRLESERDAIKNLIQQAIRIEIETDRAEQERIESTLRDIQSTPKEQEKEFVDWADDEKLVWPFNDEYWRDELGTYELTLAHSCR
ncbi:MAG: hypothetical protein U1E65_33120 [Myxococcota bacterium]